MAKLTLWEKLLIAALMVATATFAVNLFTMNNLMLWLFLDWTAIVLMPLSIWAIYTRANKS